MGFISIEEQRHFVADVCKGNKLWEKTWEGGVNILAVKALGIDKYVQSVQIFLGACVFLRHPFTIL